MLQSTLFYLALVSRESAQTQCGSGIDCTRRQAPRQHCRQYNDDTNDDRDDPDRGCRGRQFGRKGHDNQKKGNRVATGERGKRRKSNEHRATTSKNPLA